MAQSASYAERLEPGTHLSRAVDDDDERTRICARVLRRLHVPLPDRGIGTGTAHRRGAAPVATHGGDVFRNVAVDAARWSRTIADDYVRYGAPFARRVVDEAVDHAKALSSSLSSSSSCGSSSSLPRSSSSSPSPASSSLVLCHQDLHAGNVLLADADADGGAGDARWRAIDPKPVAADAAFDAAAVVRCDAGERTRERVMRRLDIVVDELGIDRERARMWTIVHTLAWGVADDGARAGFIPGHVAVACWLCGE